MFDTIDDTIVAVSSGPGSALRGIVRLSGPRALSIASSLFVGDDGEPVPDRPGFTRLFGRVHFGGRPSLPAECYVFRGPHSFTRQDCAELPLIRIRTSLR